MNPQRPVGHAVVRREGEALLFDGALLRSAIATLWPQATKIVAGARRFDLRAVTQVDSAGLALLVELAALAGGGVAIDGKPTGLAELGAAYRLTPALAFAT